MGKDLVYPSSGHHVTTQKQGYLVFRLHNGFLGRRKALGYLAMSHMWIRWAKSMPELAPHK
jgi:hypothetical protein